MEFVEQNCPFCKGLLQVPNDLEECVCMYCGKKIYVGKKSNTVENSQEYERLCVDVWENACKMLTEHLQLMKSFKANKYEAAFQDYLTVCLPTLQEFDQACARIPYVPMEQVTQEQFTVKSEERLIQNLVEHILNGIEEQYKITRHASGKITGSMKVDEIRFVSALFFVPMIRETKLETCEKLAEAYTTEWGKRYPHQKFTKADYQDIRDGFSKKKLCFITTAVCESFGKPDDCEELQAFRKFRDQYLLVDEEGKKMVEVYYAIAPTIVQIINTYEERDRIYHQIWEQYLCSCFAYIKNKQYEQCRKQYMDMVNTLTRTFVLPEIDSIVDN
ncbi:CFI-box-CTERM domain-containing protein [Anaerosporobacter faecicola]|uniref:CFI-box-CTERM domain-containing protein n=1 Tax=Anaerosporobacter faecicola TaxID=2718714 RepID=UPI0014398452|nr:CFI-box-CTERM domain-containing protein [Anaerosporobacter faecicola]